MICATVIICVNENMTLKFERCVSQQHNTDATDIPYFKVLYTLPMCIIL